MNKISISYSERYLHWQLGLGDGSHPTNPEQARIAVENLITELEAGSFEVIEIGEDDYHSGETWYGHAMPQDIDSYRWDGPSHYEAFYAYPLFSMPELEKASAGH